ncbi:hypothetical protein EGI32_01660 [Ferruginibacter sp. HRS2-29]|nr:hypothetical protein [Ferruginibacter sp. HRS2-29]
MVQWLTEELLKSGVKIIYDTKVKPVDWYNHQVQVSTDNGMHLEASKILITLPVSLLSGNKHENSIRFTPALPSYRQAADNIGFGNVVKLFVGLQKNAGPKMRASSSVIIHNTEEEILAKALRSFNTPECFEAPVYRLTSAKSTLRDSTLPILSLYNNFRMGTSSITYSFMSSGSRSLSQSSMRYSSVFTWRLAAVITGVFMMWCGM